MSKARSIGPAGMGGMTALRGASSLIKSIQRGTVAIAGASASGTATIAAVDLPNTRLRMLGYSNNNAAAAPSASSMRIVLTDATTITATRVTTGASDDTVAYEVVEYLPGVIKSVQRGTISIASAATNTATITEVNTAKSELDFLGCSMTSSLDTLFTRLALTNGTTVTATRSGSGADTSVASYQVVEWF